MPERGVIYTAPHGRMIPGPGSETNAVPDLENDREWFAWALAAGTEPKEDAKIFHKGEKQ